MATSGKIIKMEVDFSDTVDKKLPKYQELAQVIISNFIFITAVMHVLPMVMVKCYLHH